MYVVRNLKEFKCGSVVIPFDNQISKDTDLYKLYNTNIHDIITYVAERDYDILYRDLSHSYEIYPVRWKVPQMQAGGKSGQHWKGYSAYAFFHGSKVHHPVCGVVSACPVCSGGTCGASDYCCHSDYL